MNYLGYAIASAGGGGSDLTDVKSNIDPNITDTYDIGRSTKRWRTGEFRTLKANEYIVNGGTSQQYLMGDGSLTTGGGGTDLTEVKTDIDPDITDTRDIGNTTKRWRIGEFVTLNADLGQMNTVNADNAIIGQITCTSIGSNDLSVNVTTLNGLTASKYIVNGGTSQQYLMGDGSLTTGGGGTDLTEVKTDIDPDITDTRDIGSTTKRWRTGEFVTLNANEYIVNGGTSQQYLMGDGSLLQYSANSGNSNYYLYKSSQILTTPPPAGFIRYNNIVQGNATEIYISNLTRDNINIEIFLIQINIITTIYIQDQNDSLNFIEYNVLALPQITPNLEVTVSVSKSVSGGTGQSQFPNGRDILLSFFTNGIEVDSRLTSLETKTEFVQISPPSTMGISADTFYVKSLYGSSDVLPLPIGNNSSSVDIMAPLLKTTNIIATSDNTYDLGFLGNQFRAGYFGTSLRCPVYDTASSTLLQIAPINASAVNIGRGGITSTILGTTSINSVYTLPSTAPAVGAVLTCSALGVSNWITPAPTTTPLSSFSNYQLNFSQAGLLTSQNGFLPTTSLTSIGGTTTAVTTVNTSARNRIFKAQNPTLSVADGQKSGYVSSLTVNTWPIFFGRTGIILNIASGIGDTNTTTNAVTQMFQGLTNISTVPSFSSTLGPNTTPSIIGWGHDLGDSVISFYFRGVTNGFKIATPFSTSTPSPYWFNFNVSNACNSDLFILTLTDIISGLTATQNFTMAVFDNSVMSPDNRLFLLSCRGMAVAGGTTNSAISQFSRFGLSLK